MLYISTYRRPGTVYPGRNLHTSLLQTIPLWHWPTEKDFVIRFGSIIPAKDILPCQVAECILVMKFKMTREGSSTALKLKELSMQLEDMEGAHINGRNSPLILKEALSVRWSRNYGEVLESCRLYSKVQNELKMEY